MRQNRTKIEQALSGGIPQGATQDAAFDTVVQELTAMYQTGRCRRVSTFSNRQTIPR